MLQLRYTARTSDGETPHVTTQHQRVDTQALTTDLPTNGFSLRLRRVEVMLRASALGVTGKMEYNVNMLKHIQRDMLRPTAVDV